MTEGLLSYFGEFQSICWHETLQNESSHIQRMVALLDSETNADDVSMSGAGACDIQATGAGESKSCCRRPMPRHVRKLSEAVLAKIHTMEMRFATMK